MHTLERWITVLGLIVIIGGLAPVTGDAATRQDRTLRDIADVPLPVQALPEDGYQVLTGGYLDLDASATWIAEPRGMSRARADEELTNAGWLRSYVLDAVLLEDRAFAGSDILSLVQTNVLAFPDTAGATQVYTLMTDYANRADAEMLDSPEPESMTVRLTSQSGDTVRTVAMRDDTIVEVVTLDTFGFVDEDAHDLTVGATLDRLVTIQEQGGTGLAPQAARLADGDRLADLQNVQQSGVHHLYRLRDGQPQPAAGEVVPEHPGETAPGLVELYVGSEGLRLDGGTGFLSLWIATFDTNESAALFVADITAGDPSNALLDPYFRIAEDEQASSQGIAGVYRVTGIYQGQRYSGSLEIRQQGSYVVATGFRTVGDALPAVDVTSYVMDHQLECLDVAAICPPVDVSGFLEPPMATPVDSSIGGGRISSNEFGWSVDITEGDWNVTEQFAEPGYDFVELRSASSLVTLESVINQHGDAQQCVLEELDALQEFESSAVIELSSDDPDEAPAGMEPGHAWAVYTVEPLDEERADQEYTLRIDCYTIIEGGANLVVTHRAPRYEWESERERGTEIRDTIVLPSSSVTSGPVAFMAGPGEFEWRLAV